NAPYVDGTPFYYILMDSTTASLAASLETIDLSIYTSGFLATNGGGPQAEVSVILPQDNE